MIKYEELDFKKLASDYESLLEGLKTASDVETAESLIDEIDVIRSNFNSMDSISDFFNKIDVNDEYYKEQTKKFNEQSPIFNNLGLKYYSILSGLKFKGELAQVIGPMVIKKAEYSARLLNDDIVPDLTEEQKLISEYNNLVASKKIKFNGEEMSLSLLAGFLSVQSRKIRKSAHEAYNKAYLELENDLDRIYDSLVKVRDGIARKLGFKTFTEVGYIRKQRLNYNRYDVETFRKLIVKYIVPFVLGKKEKQRRELGLESLTYYDQGVLFKDGNALPKGDSNLLVSKAIEMYEKISPVLAEHFRFLKENNLMDLDSRLGKSDGGFCYHIRKINVPLIFANFNNSSNDIKVLTHEFGHALNKFLSKDIKYPENLYGGTDQGEIHSMTMELLTLPYIDYLTDDYEKYRYETVYNHLANNCYMCLVDHFQHEIYDKPGMSIKERKETWKKLENIYMPWLDYSECDYLARGNFWQRQLHIFVYPFYYIDYALANIVSLQFYKISLEDEKKAWEMYFKFCSQGGKYMFRESLAEAGLKSPFDDDTIKEIVDNVKI